MNDLSARLTEQYAAALDGYLAGQGEIALNEAYELGRKAYAEGLGVLDMAMLHHGALAKLSRRGAAADRQVRMGKAAEFFAESLSPFEMSFRVIVDANARLHVLNESLQQANRRLETEMAERQRVEEVLRQAQKLQAVGRLAGGVAHDFNNLLTVVLGNLDIACERAEGDEVMVQMLGAALRAAGRGARVTKMLLAFSRQQMLKPEVIEPAKRLLDISALLGGSLRGDITIDTAVAPDLWAVEIDPVELELAMLNLGLNARDAMQGGGVLRVAAANRTVHDDRLGLHGDYVVVEVADNGTGIPSDVLPRVFEPFFTTKDVGAGSGLGLSQVHGFAHQSGGAVDIESALGKGTAVRLFLPAAHGRVLAEPPASPTHQHSATGTVLVVEDDVDVANLAARLLQRCGFHVKLVFRARAALDLLNDGENVDLVFSDILMPDGMNGIQLAEEVKTRYPGIPVLLATGYSDAGVDATARGLQIIAKPYRTEELCACVTDLLRPH